MTAAIQDLPPGLVPRDFVIALTTEGEVSVSAFADGALAVEPAAREALCEWDAAARLDLSGDAGPIDLAAAEWALVQFYRACQLLVCRDAPAETVARELGFPCPVPRGPAVDFSVDLVFRFLPGLFERARQLAPGDALVIALTGWARTWPLSSPGIPLEAPPPALDSFSECPALWRLYADRVAAQHARDRWLDARVAEQLRADLGAFPSLDSTLASALGPAALSA